jgi:hypothetical protein
MLRLLKLSVASLPGNFQAWLMPGRFEALIPGPLPKMESPTQAASGSLGKRAF